MMLTSSDGGISYLLKNLEWEILWPPDLEDGAECNIGKFVNGTKLGHVAHLVHQLGRRLRDWSVSSARRGWEIWGLASRKDTLDGIWSMFINICWEGVKKMALDSSQRYTVTGQEAMSTSWKRKFFWSIRKQNHTVTVRVAEHWNRLLKGIVESLSLEIIQIQLGQGPGQLALGDPALSGEVGVDDF